MLFLVFEFKIYFYLLNPLTSWFGCYNVDALDECSKDLRSRLLVSSRHSLDIGDSLHGVVCIETRDNADDLQRYVETELDSIIQSIALLEHWHEAHMREVDGFYFTGIHQRAPDFSPTHLWIAFSFNSYSYFLFIPHHHVSCLCLPLKDVMERLHCLYL
ncbi:hypothetical protein EV426DRAFT_70697 [Tirmania nivea]|nr:hypothetical protein EV426DRAFT_70697 [Tirmania nivea]